MLPRVVSRKESPGYQEDASLLPANPEAGMIIPDMVMLDLEVNPRDLHNLLSTTRQTRLLDVREPWETQASTFPGAVTMPMGDVPSRVHQELDPDDHIVVICHHGMRSLSVANWLRNQGFEQAQSLRGGIDAWSRDVDPAVTRY